MSPSDLSIPLRQLADYAEIRGHSAEATGWRRLASDIEQSPIEETERFRELARQNRLGEIPGTDPSIRLPLEHLLFEGPAAVLAVATAALPSLIRRLIDTGVVDSAAAALLSRHGIVTFADFELALDDGRAATHLPDQVDALRAARASLVAEQTVIPLGRAIDLLENFVELLASACPEIRDATPAGDVRRYEPLCTSLVLVASAGDPPSAIEKLCALVNVQLVVHRSARRAVVVFQHAEIDVRIAAPDEAGTARFVATGAPAHLAAMRARQSAVRLAAREEDVYAQAGLAWIPPELRHDTGEIEAAVRGALPALVTREQIRGDLHMHTTYSDGRDTLVAMVETCAALGYDYIAITDHSERAAASRTVSRAALTRQRDEIDRLRHRFPALTILHGVEVDIMRDGSLDFPDSVLETLDIVLASLHDNAGHTASQLTRRCLAAIAHPLVNVITHPANRLVGQHPGYELDFASVYAAAAETGTALEIDGAPMHLDMDGDHARGAVEAGVTVTIDSDCHRARLLDRQMRLGIGTARRGWVEARHVLNTRPLDEVRAFVSAKRTRR